MKLFEYVVHMYYNIPIQKFTEKAMTALSIFEFLDTEDESTKESYRTIKRIINNTDEERINVPIYQLDMYVNPDDKVIPGRPPKRFSIIRVNAKPSKSDGSVKRWEATQPEIQMELCKAIERVNNLITRELRTHDKDLFFSEMVSKERKKSGQDMGGDPTTSAWNV